MIAVYNNKEYYYVLNKKISNLVTKKKTKIDLGFKRSDNKYFKPIQKEELKDIFDIEYWVTYDCGINNISTEWKIGSNTFDIIENSVLIRYSDGIIPGWDIEEKSVCTKLINKKEISNFKIIKKYIRKDNLDLPEILEEEIKLNFNEFKKIHNKYCKYNL